MVDADQLRIVFHVDGVGFVMPVADLLAIRGQDEYVLAVQEKSASPFQVGLMAYRGTDVPVYTLASLFELTEADPHAKDHLLVFSGADCPWAVKVDHVDGVVDAAHFKYQDVPTYLFRDGEAPYSQVALYQSQLLISVGAETLAQAWSRSG